MILSYTLILPMSQLETHQLMTSQIRSHTEYLIRTYNISMLILYSKLIVNVAALLPLLWLEGRGHPLVSIACLTTLCNSARSVAFHLSVCRSSLHQSVISSVHSRHGLPFRALPSITPNTQYYTVLTSIFRYISGFPDNSGLLLLLFFRCLRESFNCVTKLWWNILIAMQH